MKKKKHYYLMISCPNDVIRERELLKECVEIINNERNDDWVELKYWVTDTFSDAGTPAQESINRQMVDESDGLIAIFNARLGTPVHEYPCGTAEEIALMLSAQKHVSVLFNTSPRIDLKKGDAIDQITELEKYKKEQSTKWFYKEFKDEESFNELALREIRFWLRSIKSTENEITVFDGGKVASENSKDVIVGNAPISNDTNVERTPTANEQNDGALGFLDCVVYINNTALELKTLFDEYNELILNFQVKTDDFSQKFTFANKQKNTTGVLTICKAFAKETKNWVDELELFNNNFESKWNDIFSYMKIMPKDMVSQDDKIIMRSTLGTLRNQFLGMSQQTSKLLFEIKKMPNLQKDFNSAMVTVKSSFERFNKFLYIAVMNCEELENLFI